MRTQMHAPDPIQNIFFKQQANSPHPLRIPAHQTLPYSSSFAVK